MLSLHRSARLAALVLAVAATRAAAQTKPAETPRPEKAEEYVTEKGFRSRVFEVRHRDPSDLANVLRPLGSGWKGAALLANRDLRTLSVRDFPENLAAMEEALKRLDTPETALRDVELRIHVIVASRSDGPGGAFPPELKPVLDALRSTLNYRSYRMLTTLGQRAKDRTRGLHGEGTVALDEAVEGKERPFSVAMEYGLTELSVSGGAAPGSSTIRIDGFRFKGWGVFGYEGRVELATDLTLRDGEQVVVGTSVLKDKGIVLVVSARIAS